MEKQENNAVAVLLIAFNELELQRVQALFSDVDSSHSGCESTDFIDADLNGVESVATIKEFKKALKKQTFSALVFNISGSDNGLGTENYQTEQAQKQKIAQEGISFVKDILNQDDLLIILVTDAQASIDFHTGFESDRNSGCDESNSNLTYCSYYRAHLAVAMGQLEQAKSQIHSLLSFSMAMQHKVRRELIQKNLLATAASFAHDNLELNQTIERFAGLLSEFSQSDDTFIVKYKSKENVIFKHIYNGYSDQELHRFSDSDISGLIEKAIQRKVPQIELIPDSSHYAGVRNKVRCSPGCYLSFPIIVYGKVVCLIVSFLPEDKMDRLNVGSVEVMEEACEVIRVVIERRVAENKLKSQYLRTKAALIELNDAKEQLIHNEKMATVGQIAAGIAHEINNPLAYVLSNFQPLDDYVDTLVKLIQLQDQLVANLDQHSDDSNSEKHLDSVLADIEGLKVEADLEYLMEDIRDIVDDSRSGLLRVRDIISDLGAFAKQQRLERSVFDLQQLVDETLRILKYELNDDVTVEQKIEVASDINSHRGFIQQIITNLIKNAAQAICQCDQVHDKQNRILIKANLINSNLILKVIDNGPGMKPEVAKKIFTPFFSTKDVGKGTGLGLSVSHNLARKMGGDLTVRSKLGVGTEFELSIPDIDGV